MKFFIITIAFLTLISCNSTAQVLEHNLQKIIKKNKKLAKHNLIKKEGSDLNDKIFNWSYIQQLEYLPIASFVFSKNISDFDSTKKIIDFIILNKKTPLQDFYTLKDGKYEGVKSLFNEVYFNSKGFSSGYDSSKTFVAHSYNTLMYNGLKKLQEHNFEFLFSVKYFRNTIWFVENENVLLLDLKELKIYDPDVYLKQKCSVAIIKDLANNILTKFCN